MMPAGRFKSRRFRKIFVRTPGSRVKVHYRERKPKRASCGSCGTQLAGVPRERPAIFKKLAKSSRRPERPYGGVLCSKCMRAQIRNKTIGELS
ncbi:MAG TPA: 50S ribosomal protein L34e [Candidatus Nanoarchaeia archaeon]|nr:50S ribosomal protein L34e [Candidatus Nanoarchaeia archaeon]